MRGAGQRSRRGRLRRLPWLLLALAALAVAGSARLARPSAWREIDHGLAYRRLSLSAFGAPGTFLHVLRVDLAHFRIRVHRVPNAETATAEQMASDAGAVAAINGGFFDEQFRPLGLRVSGGRAWRPLRRADWGVFLVRQGRASVVHRREYRPAGVAEALQCGPRLVVAGRVTRLKRQSARRACVGIDRRGRVLLVVSQGDDLEASVLGRALAADEASGGLGCRDALNLDGGPSAQLFVRHRGFRLDLPGGWGVPDGLVAIPR